MSPSVRFPVLAGLTLASSVFTLLAACGGGGGTSVEADGPALRPAGSPPGPSTASTPTLDDSASRAPATETGASADDTGHELPTIFTIVFENHDYDEIIGSPDAPFFNELVGTFGLATNYMDCDIHPSLGNYLCMISGEPQYPGGKSYLPTDSFGDGSFPVAREHLGSQLDQAGIPWGSYQESMGKPCLLTPKGLYAPKHDPFLYFKDIQTNRAHCDGTNVDYSELEADMAAGKNRYYFITPNLVNDGHDPRSDPKTSMRNSDTWARAEIGKLMESSVYRNGNAIIFITWDEGVGRVGDSSHHVPMIVVSRRIKSHGFTSSRPYSHRSYLATVEDLLGLPRLATVKSEAAMTEFLQ